MHRRCFEKPEFEHMLTVSKFSLQTIHQSLELHKQHHVAFDLDFAAPERLHWIQLLLSQSLQVRFCNCDRHIWLVVSPNVPTSFAILQIQHRLGIWTTITDLK